MTEWWEDHERRAACPEVWGVPVVGPKGQASGGRSVSTPKSRERFVHPIAWPCSAGELARRYLRTCLRAQRPRFKSGSPLNPGPGARRGPRLPFRSASLPWFSFPRNAAFYAGGVHAGEWSVIDVTSAYYAVATAAPMDLWLRWSSTEVHASLGHCEFLRAYELQDKPVQRAVVGMFARREMTCEQYGKPRTFPWSSFCGPDLTGLVHLTMMAIAHDAVANFGAVHFATDAAVVPLERAEDWQGHLGRAWGLSSHVITEGPGTLYGHNCWDIGDQGRNVRRFRTASGSRLPLRVAMGPQLVASVQRLRRELLERERAQAPWPAS